jgi:flagellar hook-associated protein 2
LQQQKAKADDEATALGSLTAKTSALKAALSFVEASFGSASLATSVGNPTAASVNVTDSASAGTWQVRIDDLGSSTAFVASGFPATSDVNASGYLTGGSQTLVIGSDAPVSLSPEGTSLQALVTEINKKAGSKVQATVVNIGTSGSPNYQLSLQSKTLGAVDLQLTDGALSSSNTAGQRGTSARYSVNGADIAGDSRSVTLAPGITLDLKTTTTSAFTLSVQSSNSTLNSALQKFINAYNDVNTEMDKHRGNSKAALAGHSVLSTVSGTLRQLTSSAAPAGGFSSLAGLGVSFDKNGRLYLDQSVFSAATSDSGLAKAQTFLGKAASSGWLKTADGLLDSLTKVGSGALSSALSMAQAASADQQTRIDAQQERVDQLQKDLQARMAAADATIAMLEQQATYFTGMYAAMRAHQSS